MGVRLLSSIKTEEDKWFDNSLRPEKLADYVGQERIKENLKIFIEAAKKRDDALDHVLLYGAPGLGKTTMANIIARELGVKIRATSGPAIQRPIDLLIILKNLQEKEVLFIDEIHRLSKVVEEVLYPAMEDFTFDRVISKGATSRAAKIKLPKFTLVGATTRSGAISSPLRDRFGIIFHLHFYTPADLESIVLRSSDILKIKVKKDGAAEIASRARGTPRIANRLLKRVRDFAQVLGDGSVDVRIAGEALEKLGVDQMGLDDVDRRILRSLVEKFKGGPVGIETLAATVNEESENIEEVYEPYLLQNGLIMKTPRGRTATPGTYSYFNMEGPKVKQQKLFFGND